MQTTPPTQSAGKTAIPKGNSKGRHRAATAAKETLRLKDKTVTATASKVDVVEKIAKAAYFLAEQRGFEPGHELDDWLSAEQQMSSLHS